jgi:eukaryotic-like serine/threonine-protein kinase
MPDLIGKTIGRYRILELVGEGGMAAVYRAFDTRLKRDVAFKVLLRESHDPNKLERLRRRFEREAQALARLDHTNIVRIFDFGEKRSLFYLVMPFLDGGSWGKLMGKAYGWQEAVCMILPIACALEHAHQHGIIHRDVKPSNILMTYDGQPYLSDFGIARLVEDEGQSRLTSTGVGVGTPEYMSPEQVKGEEVDARSDIYSLGIVFFELLTGRVPFRSNTPMGVGLKHLGESLPSPRLYAPGLPEELERIVLRMMAKAPGERIQSMREVATLLEGLVKSEGSQQHRGEEKDLLGKQKVRDEKANEVEHQRAFHPQEKQPQPQILGEKAPGEEKRDKHKRQKHPIPLTRDDGTVQSVPVKEKVRRAQRKKVLPAVGGFLVLGLIILGFALAKGRGRAISLQSTSTSTSTSTFTSTITLTITDTGMPLPSSTAVHTATPENTPVPTQTLTPLISPTASPGIGSTVVSSVDGMALVYVPAGEFEMGTSDEKLERLLTEHSDWQRQWFADEQPAHTVYLDSFWIDLMEVTNAKYALCVAAGSCVPPYKINSTTHPSYYGNDRYANYPVIHVDWSMAKAYCEWTGRRLPSEAEWEKAARGTDGGTYPWGNENLNCNLANYWGHTNGCIGDTAEVGSYPAGASPYGALDMAGNVWEWVNDWFDGGYYALAPSENPAGPLSGSNRVIRGGSWYYFDDLVRAARRYNFGPGYSAYGVGFRCAVSAESLQK